MDVSKSLNWSLLLVVIAFIDTGVSFTKALERSKLDGHDSHDIELYIEQRLNFIHAKIDLRPTITGLISLNKFATKLDGKQADSLGSSLSKNLLKRLDRIVNKLRRVNEKIPLPSRSKRAIEFLGNLISDIFGNPGPADWKQANANFLALQNALKKLNDNSLEDHHIIDSNTHTIERHNVELRELSSVINRNQNEIVNMNSSLNDLRLYFEIVNYAETLESQVNSLVEIKRDSLKGFCSDQALSKEFLINNLQTLEANKVGLGPVFGSWEWREYYKHDMCTAAVENDVLWITLRIPQVKKAEKLVRIIPTPFAEDLLAEARSFSLQVVLFREKSNDKFHAMTQQSLDLCNNLGKVRTCGVRDTRFALTVDSVLPVEFHVNKFLLVGRSNASTTLMEKCSNGITEHIVLANSVLMVPNDCSYVSKEMSISTREADVDIMKEIGILQFEKFTVTSVFNAHLNRSRTNIGTIASRASNNRFENNKREIDSLLTKIDTKHESLSSTYWLEKWIFVGAFLALVLGLVSTKIVQFIRKPSQRGAHLREEVQMVPVNDQVRQITRVVSCQDEHIELRDFSKTESCDENVYQDVPVTSSRLSLGARPERSQFYKK